MWLFLTLFAIVLVLLFIFYMKSDADLVLAFYDALYPNLKSYKGKTVWVVGASTGIGQSIAFELARHGSRLILTATSLDKLRENRQKCIELSNGLLKEEDVHIASFNITDKEQMQKHFQDVITKFGHVDILVNNAGILQVCSAVEMTDEQLERVMNINFFANVRLSQLVSREWIRTHRPGKIIVTSSLAAIIPFPLYSAYIASKTALHGFYNAMRTEVSGKKISITLVCPGGVFTEIIKKPVTEDKRVFQVDLWNSSSLIMTADRCAHLMLVAGANRIAEGLVANAPQVLGGKIFELFGGFIRPLMAYFATEKMIKKFEEKVLQSPKQD